MTEGKFSCYLSLLSKRRTGRGSGTSLGLLELVVTTLVRLVGSDSRGDLATSDTWIFTITRSD